MKILKIWGIPICKILSHTEFIAKTRKILRLSRKVVWFHVAVLLMVCVFVLIMAYIVWPIAKYGPNETRLWVAAGLLFGFLSGGFIGQHLIMDVQGILPALDLFDYNRTPRLLIKYHDMLKDMGPLDHSDEQQDELSILRTKEV